MPENEAAHFISDMTTFDFFEDLTGSMDSFLQQFRGLRDLVLEALASSKKAMEAAREVDSDEDEDGNLR